MRRPLSPEQIAKIKAAKRRRKERKERVDEARRRQQDTIRRQIAEARARRKRFLFLLLMAMFIFRIANDFVVSRPVFYRPEPAPERPRRKEKRQKKPEENKEIWKPSPENDFAPRPGSDDYCDGYSREGWERMADEKGWRPGSKLAQKRSWENDPQRPLFPERYRDWDHRPSLYELTREFCDMHQRDHAFQALKLIAPPETHQWLDEAYTLDPGRIRRAFAHRSDEIAQNFKDSAVRWEEQKRREAEEATKQNKTDDDDKEWDV